MFDSAFKVAASLCLFWMSVSWYGFFFYFCGYYIEYFQNQLLFLYCVVLKIATANFKNKVQEVWRTLRIDSLSFFFRCDYVNENVHVSVISSFSEFDDKSSGKERFANTIEEVVVDHPDSYARGEQNTQKKEPQLAQFSKASSTVFRSVSPLT